MKKLNEADVEFYNKIMDKINKLELKHFETVNKGLRIFIDKKHTVRVIYESKREIYMSFNTYGDFYFLIGGWGKRETEELKSIRIHKWRDKTLFNDINEFIQSRTSGLKLEDHIRKQKIINDKL